MEILTEVQIDQKILRLSHEIIEKNFGEKEIIVVGVNSNGYSFAELIVNQLQNISDIKFVLTRVVLNPANPVLQPAKLELDIDNFVNKTILIIDDVANTGRTLFYAFKPFLDILTSKIEVAVLVDRKHKSFPIKVDYMGLSLATTLKENIRVVLKDVKGVWLE